MKLRWSRINPELVVLIAISAFFLCVSTYGYHLGLYNGDGFNTFQFLRNFSHGYGAFEGPSYEHHLSLHSYITLPLFSPLLWIYNSPLTFHWLGHLAYGGSAVLFYLWARDLLKELPGRWAFVLALSYLFHAITVDGAFGFIGSLFQPEFQVAFLVMLIFWSFYTQRFWLCVAALLFLVLAKEDFFFLVPPLILWLPLSARMVGRPLVFSRSQWLVLAVGWAVCTVSAHAIMSHYKSLNFYNHINRNADLRSVLDWRALVTGRDLDADLLVSALFWSMPFPLFLPWALFARRWRLFSFLALTSFGFVVVRLLVDRQLYGPKIHSIEQFISNEETWAPWSRVTLPPLLAATALLAVYGARNWLRNLRWALILTASLAGLSVVLCSYFRVPRYYRILSGNLGYFAYVAEPAERAQRLKIAEVLKPYGPSDVILMVTDGFEMHVSHMTMAQYFRQLDPVEYFSAPRGKSWLDQARFVLALNKTMGSAPTTVFKDFRPILRTEDYTLFERDSSVPLKPKQWRYW